MKKKLVATLFAVAMVAGLAVPAIAECGYATEYGYTDVYTYPDCGMVINICNAIYEHEICEYVSFVTQNGNEFSFYSDVADYDLYDLVAVTMLTNGTESVRDDIVTDAKYVGYISDTETKNWIKK